MTEKQLAEARRAFRDYLAHWQELLGLGDWRIVLSTGAPSSKKIMAEVSQIDLEQRLASIRLGKDFGSTVPVTADTLSAVALHEVLHVFHYELRHAAAEHGVDATATMSAEHRNINTLVRLLEPTTEI